MSDELKPCPFCNGEAFKYDLDSDPQFGTVKVIRCKTIPCQAAIMGKDDTENVTAWNRRVPDAAQAEALERVWEALQAIGDIARGLRKCRHGRTCCQENDNTVGAINDMVKALASLPPPAVTDGKPKEWTPHDDCSSVDCKARGHIQWPAPSPEPRKEEPRP